MPYKDKCFSRCRSLDSKRCSKLRSCRTLKAYDRSGSKIKGYCRLSNKYKLTGPRRRSGTCRVTKKKNK